jgi:hypothetical protein
LEFYHPLTSIPAGNALNHPPLGQTEVVIIGLKKENDEGAWRRRASLETSQSARQVSIRTDQAPYLTVENL